MKRIPSLLAGLLGAVLLGNAAAQQFPSKPVRIVVSYPPGGPVDVLARPLAEGLQKIWGGNPVIVENKPGANAIIGTDYAAKQPADGHTLLLANDPSLSPFDIALIAAWANAGGPRGNDIGRGSAPEARPLQQSSAP